MGCDIYFFVERKTEFHDRWLSCDIWIQSDCSTRYKFSYELRIPYWKQFYNGRNYRLFAKLAGIKSYDDIKPIARPRGLPKDISELVNNVNVRLAADFTSWFTLEELLKEDWAGEQYEDFRETLEKMKKLGDPDKVRAVFWFDT